MKANPPSRNIALRLWILGLVSLCWLAACQTPPPRPKALFVIIDGVPADVLEATNTPNLDEIADEGGYTRGFVGGERGQDSESPTVSAVGYNSLLTGTWANKHNVWDNQVGEPNYAYWDIFRIAKAFDPDLHTALFSTWLDNRTKLLGDGLAAAGGHKLDFHADGFEHDLTRFPHQPNERQIQDIDALVADEAARYVSERGPDLSWVYLQYTDDIGHQHGDSPQQSRAVEFADELVGRIWQSVTARERTRAEDWLVLVTTDHGRDKLTGKHHGGQTDRERTIWIVTNSKRLNDNFNAGAAIVDILPSLAAHLGIEIPNDVASKLDGASFIDAPTDAR